MKYSYWLANIPGIGRKKICRLLQNGLTSEEIYYLTPQQLERIPGLNKQDRDAIEHSRRNWDLSAKYLDLIEEGMDFVSCEMSSFPERLRHIADPPYALYFKGELPKEQRKSIAVVGARSCSEYGRHMAFEIGKYLASCEVEVISGMATGIDSQSHWGALSAGGNTYAVLGSGADVCYPEHAGDLYQKIISQGAVISESPPGTKPHPGLFPQRNRIISGLSDGVIIVEAREKSGSLITVDFALDQGRDIYAVPGRTTDSLSAGCNQLIAQGAGIITTIEKFMTDLDLKVHQKRIKYKDSKNLLEKEELLLYSCFDLYSKSLNELTSELQMPPRQVAALIGSLIGKGFLVETFQNNYRKT